MASYQVYYRFKRTVGKKDKTETGNRTVQADNEGQIIEILKGCHTRQNSREFEILSVKPVEVAAPPASEGMAQRVVELTAEVERLREVVKGLREEVTTLASIVTPPQPTGKGGKS